MKTPRTAAQASNSVNLVFHAYSWFQLSLGLKQPYGFSVSSFNLKDC